MEKEGRGRIRRMPKYIISEGMKNIVTQKQWEDELRVAGGQQDSIKPPKDWPGPPRWYRKELRARN